MAIWSAEIKELEKLYESFKGQLPELERELGQLIKTEDPNVILLYSRRCLEVVVTDLCECELKRERGTEPLKGIVDKLNKEKKIQAHIITSMHGLNELSVYGTHPKDFDPEQVKPALNNLSIILKWYIKYKDLQDNLESIEKNSTNISYAESSKEKSIAVLPFVNMSPEKDQDYFCDGITEEIINALAHIESFKVISRTSAFAFKDKQVDIREIGRKLDVETLLEGSIRKAGNRLRITTQLIKVSDGSHIWSERYDRDIKDIFIIQDEISMAVVNNLKIKLLGDVKTIIAKRHSDDLEAYNLYLKGTYYWQMLTSEGYNKATEYFEQALQKDPNYALVYVGLAAIYNVSTTFGNVPPNKAYPKAYEFAVKALKIDCTLAEAYSLLGNINTFYYWNWVEAELNFKHALQINPNSSLIHMYYSFLLTCTGRFNEAVSEARRAQELDPLSSYINTETALAISYTGQLDKAIEEYQMTLTINSNYFYAHLMLGNAYFTKSMIQEAVTEIERAVNLSDGNVFALSCLISGYYLIGKKDQAEKLFNHLKKKSESEYVPATSFYMIHRFRGEEEYALEWLRKACEEHDTFLPWMRVNPNFVPKGSKYMALLKEVGLDY